MTPKEYILNPHPDKFPGLRVAICETGDVRLQMVGTNKKFALSPEAALGLASLIQLTVKADGYFSLAS